MGPLWVAADGFPSISRSSPTLGLSSPAKNLLQSAKMRLLRSNHTNNDLGFPFISPRGSALGRPRHWPSDDFDYNRNGCR